MPLDLPFPFTLPRLFRSPAISNFFSFPLGLRNSGVRLYEPPQGVFASFRSENGYSLRSFWYIPAYPNQNSQVYPRCVFMSSRNAGVLCDDTKKGFVEDYGIRGVARNFPEVRGSFPNHLYTKIR